MVFKFPLRGPDRVAEEIATVLSTKRAMEFKDLFDIVHANLRSKDFAKGGEEMLRLRTHEKLQSFVGSGFVSKNIKKYKGVPKMLKEFFKMADAHKARIAAGIHFQPGVQPKVSEVAAPKNKGKVGITPAPAKSRVTP
jgi:hypothetical protein